IFQNQTYTLTLDAGRMLVSGLKVPMPANVSVDNYLDIRLERLEEFDHFMNVLFKNYLALRCDEKKWSGVCKTIKEWIDGFQA
ncbi:MAG: hypothetical protein PHX74_10780, partial [Candidatus Sumerlaeales bacterium]|nr:hypothetical protein [Candidatus Sumerlaeales bacterium]